MASSKSLSSLLAQSSLDDHEDILRSAEAVLKKSKDDNNAQHARIIALLNLDRYNDAVNALVESSDSLRQERSLEYAYALYKIGKLEAAKKIAGQASGRRSMKHVQAQAAYRLEHFAEAASIYKELSKPEHALDIEDSDIRINLGATDAQLAWEGRSELMTRHKPDRADLEQFDTAFNAACSYIARGDLKQAEFLLRRAKDLCSAAEELSDADKKTELLPITIQQIYVLSRLDRQQEAEELCNNILSVEISDKTTRHIALTNQIFLNQSSNPYKSLRMFQRASSNGVADQPFQFQESILRQNKLALSLAAGKLSQFRPASSAVAKDKEPEQGDPSYGVYIAAAQAHNEWGDKAIKKVLALLDKRPRDVGLLLVVVQMYLLINQIEPATALLESFLARLRSESTGQFSKWAYAPGLVALMATLYNQLNRTGDSRNELVSASEHWMNLVKTSKPTGFAEAEYGQMYVPTQLLKATGIMLLDTPAGEGISLARHIFQEINNIAKTDPSDPVVAAGKAASSENLEVDDTVEKFLPTADKLTAGIDAEALEEAGIAKVTRLSSATTSKKRAAPDTSINQKAPKKRRGKLPKDYDPNKRPDPERWLPLRDRSTWRPTKKKKKGKAGAGAGMSTQGGIVNDDSRPGTPGQTQQQQQSQSKPVKKKGKAK